MNVKLSNSQLKKLKSGIKNGTEVTLNLPSNVIGDFNDETNFRCKLLLTNTQVSSFRKAFANGSTASKNFSKTKLCKMSQSGGYLGKLLRTLKKTGSRLMKNVLMPLSKSVLVPLGLTTAASATDAAIQKKIFEPGETTLIISDEEMNDIMEIVKFLEYSDLLIKDVSETIKNEAKEQKGGFLGLLLGKLGAQEKED